MLILTHATVLDMTGTPPRPGTTLVIDDGQITAIDPDGARPVSQDATVRDVDGAFILPGLIDAHVHNATDPSGDDRRNVVEARLERTLRGGVVAVRDMGGDARALADLARAAAAGDIASPEIRYSAIVAGVNFFTDPRVLSSSAGMAPGTAAWARAMIDSTDLHLAFAEARGAGAMAIKLYADLTPDLVARAAAAAKRQGLRVWAHLTTFPAKPSEVVLAGVEVVSHALLAEFEAQPPMLWGTPRRVVPSVTPADPRIQRLFELMRSKETIFEPTLSFYRSSPTATARSKAKRRERRAIDVARAAHLVGVSIAAGTDGMCGDDPDDVPAIHVELEMLVQAGMSPLEALTTSTRTNASVLGMSATHGTIEPGKAADLLVLSADPLVDIRNTRRIAFVVRRGQIL